MDATVRMVFKMTFELVSKAPAADFLLSNMVPGTTVQ